MTAHPTRPRARRRTVAALAALVLLATAAACSSDDGGGATTAASDDATPFTVVLEWSPNTNHGGVYLAQENGWYEEAGLDVRILEPGDAGSLQLLGSGEAQVAFTVQEEIIPAQQAGVPAVGVAAVIEHNTSSLLSLADDGITRPRDLEGATYGGFGGQLEEALLRTLVECDGGDPESVRFAEVGEADYRVGLTRDQYDVVWIFDGWDGIRLGELDDLDVATIPFVEHDDCIPDWYTPMLAASTDVIDGRPDDLRTFLDVTARGYRQAMEAPQEAADALLAAVPELDRELVERSAEHLSTRFTSDPDAWGRMEEDRWVAFADFLVEAGLVDEAGDPSEAFTNDFLPAP